MRRPDSRPVSRIEVLQRENASLRALADQLRIGVWHLQQNGSTRFASHAMCELLEVVGAEELTGRPVTDFLDEDSWLLLQVAEAPAAYDVILVDSRGTRRQVSMSAAVHVGGEDGQRDVIATFNDGRDQRAPDPDSAERMESLGRMAAGLAHEFNNLMTVIMGSAAFARQSPTQVLEAMDDIDEAAARASTMTQQLLAFARRQPMERVPVDLRPMLDRACAWLRDALPDHIDLVSDLAVDAPLVNVDVSFLEQAVMNLAANSRDAMPGGGTLTVELEAQDAGLVLRVSDTGTGMAPHTRAHALEPFFTTRPNAAGLGLATAYGVVTQLGGDLVLDSVEGNGTTVEIRLPASGVPLEQRTAPATDVRTAHEALVLVVDDEPAIRKVLEQCLTRSGYRVRLASGGDEALRMLADDVDLVVSDIRMPGMDGSQLAEKIRARRATLPILLMSGYSEHALDRAEGTAFLAKPFQLDRLLDVIARLLRR